jgi:Asp-tRNA(Asn)/Glu-tRNA(Gln) amidotransferase A subunit family amidase
MTTLASLSAAELAARIAARETSCEAVVRDCLARIEAREPQVRAWAFLDPDLALADARDRDGAPTPHGPLHGVPLGVKDIIETARMPTSYGSPIYAGYRPRADAACVRRLEAAGAVVLGKTHTTEFAFFHPGPTRNPHDPGRTPGGSSSGSAAAVADGMVPLAIGTQTAGSVVRPAAFCGVHGFKPTFGALDLSGVKPFSPSLDTLGGFAGDAADLALLVRALGGAGDTSAVSGPPRIAVVRTPEWPAAEPASRDALAEAARRAESAGARVEVLDLPEPFGAAAGAQLTIMEAEGAEALAWEYDERRDELSERLRESIERGRDLDPEAVAEARATAEVCRALLPQVFAAHDVLLVPSAPGEAPEGLGTTGDPTFCRTWTLLGCPVANVPGLRAPNGLPVGVQVVGAPGADATVLAAAGWLGQALRCRLPRT